MSNELKKINKKNADLAKTIVKATITDWAGNVLFESESYNKALEMFFTYQEKDDVTLNSYDKQGTNHGVFY